MNAIVNYLRRNPKVVRDFTRWGYSPEQISEFKTATILDAPLYPPAFKTEFMSQFVKHCRRTCFTIRRLQAPEQIHKLVVSFEAEIGPDVFFRKQPNPTQSLQGQYAKSYREAIQTLTGLQLLAGWDLISQNFKVRSNTTFYEVESTFVLRPKPRYSLDELLKDVGLKDTKDKLKLSDQVRLKMKRGDLIIFCTIRNTTSSRVPTSILRRTASEVHKVNLIRNKS